MSEFINSTFTWPCIVINSYNKTNQMHQFLEFIFGIKLYMFRTVPLSIISSLSLYTRQWYMLYSLRAGSGRNCSSVLILLARCMTYTIAVCTEKNCWWWTEERPKHVEFYSKNKFEKLVHLVGFIIRKYGKVYWKLRSPLLRKNTKGKTW